MNALYLFPPSDEPQQDEDLLAAEYALGVMDPGDAAATRLRADADPALRMSIATWQMRLLTLTEALAPTEPPAALWERLAADIGIAAPPPAPPPPQVPPPLPAPMVQTPVVQAPVVQAPVVQALSKLEAEPVAAVPAPPIPPPVVPVMVTYTPPVMEEPEPPPPVPASAAEAVQNEIADSAPRRLQAMPVRPAWYRPAWLQRVDVWQTTTAVALLAVVVLAALLMFPRTVPVRAIAAMGPVNAPAPLFLAEADGKGRLTITPLATIAVPSGRELQLWIVSPGSTAPPISLGALPPTGRSLMMGAPLAEGTQLLISMEPPGGAPGGVLTSPVLYGGTLANH